MYGKENSAVFLRTEAFSDWLGWLEVSFNTENGWTQGAETRYVNHTARGSRMRVNRHVFGGGK